MGSTSKRPVRIGNCAGAACDAGYQMYRQCVGGPIDVVTGDYLAEANLAQNAQSWQKGSHPGYEQNALVGFQLSLEAANERRIKIIVNGGALNPKGLARRTVDIVREKGLNLKVAFISGDDIFGNFGELVRVGLQHLDGCDTEVKLAKETTAYLADPTQFDTVSAHAYLGARAIKRGLDLGCDIIICGRVSDASPVVAAAWWWHGWADSDYDQLSGSLIAGHLIECSGYATGGNFSEFYKFPQEQLLDIGFPIAEIHDDGSSVITKHDNTRGFVTADIVKCQLLYEIQGDIYLNSDCQAELQNIQVKEIGKHRVRVTGTRGRPPPPTTKAAIFYAAGFQCEYVLNATGYATTEKYRLHEAQIRFRLKEEGALSDFDILEFQKCGLPEVDPKSQLRSTTALRVFGQSKNISTVQSLGRAMLDSMLQHYAGMHGTLDWRLIEPKPYLAYCPCLVPQSTLKEKLHVLDAQGNVSLVEETGCSSEFREVDRHSNYDTENACILSKFGPTVRARLGDVVLARSGDKGSNLNVGFAVREADEWEWLRSFLSRKALQELMAEEYDESYKLERCELQGIKAVHFVIFGILSRGVSSSSRLDALGKGFAEFIRDRWIDMPEQFLKRYENILPASHGEISSGSQRE